MNEYTNGTQNITQRAISYEIFCIFEGTKQRIELPPSEPSLLEIIAVKAEE